MATSQVAPVTTAADIGGGTRSTTSETVAGLHVLKIDNFSATKDLGVGKSIKSSTFRVAGHGWYVECYPCGVDDVRDGWVCLYLHRQDDDDDHGWRVSVDCRFTLMDSLERKDAFDVTVTHLDGHLCLGTEFIKRDELQSLLKDDCFRVRCTVWIDNNECFLKFPAATPQRDLATDAVAGSHVLTIDDYTKTREALAISEAIESGSFGVGGFQWCIQFYPCGQGNFADAITTCLLLEDAGANVEVKVRLEMTLLTKAGQVIASTQDFHTFTERYNAYGSYMLGKMEHQSSPLLQDGIKIRCDMAIVEGITATPNLRQGTGGDHHGSQQVRVRGDVTFEVGGHLFPAHKCVLANRCTTFMAEFSGQDGSKENADDATDHHMRVVDMEPRVFEALLHFIYTDALPEVHDDDKIVMAQGLLVAADSYAMERLKLICADMLCNHVNDASTAIDMLELAAKHGCHRLREVCKKFLMDNFAKVAP